MMFPRIIPLFFLLFAASFGFDGSRKGFILSVASGFGGDIIAPYVRVDTARGWANSRENASFCLDLKIGFNSGSNWDFFYGNKSDWMFPGNTGILNNANVLELSYRLKDEAPTVYFLGSAGWDFWVYPFDWDWNEHFTGSGFCASMGFGFEFIRHLSLQMEYLFSMPRNSSQIPESYIDPGSGNLITIGYAQFVQTNFAHSIRLTIGYMVY
jgi:hypothetical protein